MRKLLKGSLTAVGAGVVLAAGMATPANAAGIDSDFYVSAPGEGWCHKIILEFYTPGSSQNPRFETIYACGNHMSVQHFKTIHTHWKIVVNVNQRDGR
ncbi:hypothetical protein B9K03_08745 [Rothia sp. Olga]|jgi:hypothetical protein|uniref:Secreted protein n=1 Tax=Rothia aeria TaxID=172042 RepID=A0A7Z9A164_9MICC|nr:hypothetical protein [Rothia aeria]OXT10798.1 hypothetical protein B9K03_08745 [Rothia sp. Olga]VEI22078.1 Uncharacterised protein [Rothia aeria]